jgi:hypothetical protein
VFGAPATALFLVPVSLLLAGAMSATILAGVPVLGVAAMHALGVLADLTGHGAVALAAMLPAPPAPAPPNLVIYYAGVCLGWNARRRPRLWPIALAAVAASFFV